MGQFILEVQLKTNKNNPMRELYPSEDDAKAALRDLMTQVSDMKPVCISKAGGIAFPYDQLAGARALPYQQSGTVRRVT